MCTPILPGVYISTLRTCLLMSDLSLPSLCLLSYFFPHHNRKKGGGADRRYFQVPPHFHDKKDVQLDFLSHQDGKKWDCTKGTVIRERTMGSA